MGKEASEIPRKLLLLYVHVTSAGSCPAVELIFFFSFLLRFGGEIIPDRNFEWNELFIGWKIISNLWHVQREVAKISFS